MRKLLLTLDKSVTDVECGGCRRRESYWCTTYSAYLSHATEPHDDDRRLRCPKCIEDGAAAERCVEIDPKDVAAVLAAERADTRRFTIEERTGLMGARKTLRAALQQHAAKAGGAK